ncbi:MAG TPA: branched-chain amino acid transaminase [Candidatus Paceibacterota bacterium]|jgi:branched-chain amino acid aminotransferase
MAKVYDQAYMGGRVVPIQEANVSVASSAVLYGLSVYTVLPIVPGTDGLRAFRVQDHLARLINSARIIGMDIDLSEEAFLGALRMTVEANDISDSTFARCTIHVTELVPGVRSRGLKTDFSIFLYEASCILPKEGARLKTSVWRRVPDYAIPSRAKVNGAYVNSVLARQDAIDSGYDDAIFLDVSGHVCELSAANIFLVRNGALHTPNQASDILEGISRSTLIELARDMDIEVQERSIDLTELYVADEVFACGTSAYLTPVLEIDKRQINEGKAGAITKRLQTKYEEVLRGEDKAYEAYLTQL